MGVGDHQLEQKVDLTKVEARNADLLITSLCGQ